MKLTTRKRGQLIGRKNSKLLSQNKIRKQTFSYYAPEAQSVYIAGSFNEWNINNTPLVKNASGNWNIQLELLPGRHEYRFVVDGDWRNDQQRVECVPNAFGTWNSVIQIS